MKPDGGHVYGQWPRRSARWNIGLGWAAQHNVRQEVRQLHGGAWTPPCRVQIFCTPSGHARQALDNGLEEDCAGAHDERGRCDMDGGASALALRAGRRAQPLKSGSGSLQAGRRGLAHRDCNHSRSPERRPVPHGGGANRASESIGHGRTAEPGAARVSKSLRTTTRRRVSRESSNLRCRCCAAERADAVAGAGGCGGAGALAATGDR